MAWLDVVPGGKAGDGPRQGRALTRSRRQTANPANFDCARYWEGAHDLISEGTMSDGPNGPYQFVRGEFFHYRNVNIWPRHAAGSLLPRCGMTGLRRRKPVRMAAERGQMSSAPCCPCLRLVPCLRLSQRAAGNSAWDRWPRPLRLCRRWSVRVWTTALRRPVDEPNLAADYVRTLCRSWQSPFTNPPGLQTRSPAKHRDAQSGVANAVALCGTGNGKSRRPEPPVDRAIDRERHLLCRVAGRRVQSKSRNLHDSVGGFGNLLMFGQWRNFWTTLTRSPTSRLFAKRRSCRALRELNPEPKTAVAAE